ncbi:MAG: sigma-70 family RNA polymerase sigma factor [Novosphingobium sp.]|nr:sigma-70 family RNA polymerase sigma factor [Novosphingobium sp.]
MCKSEINESISYYYKSLKNYNPLTKEDETVIGKGVSEGDLVCRNKLVESHLKYVFSVANKYKNCGVDLLTLISEGNLGLIRATETFDYQRENKFITYAIHWIRQHIFECINGEKKIEYNEFSIDGDTSETTFEIEDKWDSSYRPFEDESKIEDKRKISYLLNKLTKREHDVIVLYYGLEGNTPHNIEDISEIMNLSKVRVNKLKNKAISHLRSEILY